MRLLTGAAGSGKTARVLQEFRTALASGRSDIRLLVPTATLSEHLQNELARDGVAFRSRQVSTLARFAEELAPSDKVVEPAHLTLMVERAVLDLRLPQFEKVREMAGFHARLEGTIADLDAAGCVPGLLRRIRGDLAPFRDAVASVWENVQQQMANRGVVTRGAQLSALARRLNARTLPHLIWVDGFARFTGPEIELLCALGARISLTITLPDEGVPSSLKRTLAERGFVEEKLSGGRSPATLVVVPENIEREADEIVRRMVELSRQGTPFREMGVIVRQPARYVPLLRAALERFGVPARVYTTSPLATHAVGRLLGGVVEALLAGWDHEQVLNLLRLPPVTGISPALDAFEIKLREQLPDHGLEPLITMAAGERGLKRLLGEMEKLEAWRSASHAPVGWAALLEGLSTLYWPGMIPDGVTSEALPRDRVARSRSQAAAIAAFEEAMRTAAAWWPENAHPIRLDDFWRVARTVLRSAVVAEPRGTRNSVHVISAYEARQWDLSAVFVCGLAEKEFPAQRGRDPFFSDAALLDLRRFGIQAQTAVEKEEEEFGLFDAVRARARDTLTLSYPRVDARGQQTLRSIFLADLEEGRSAPAARPVLPEPVAPWRRVRPLNAPDLRDLLIAPQQSVSVTALEMLLQCPFQYFSTYTLGVREGPVRPEERLDFLQQGNIAHKALATWLESREDMPRELDLAFREICESKRVVEGYRKERLRRLILLALERYLANSNYPPPSGALAEQQFEISVAPDLKVRGRFDRIDPGLSENEGVIVDYKFSLSSTVKEKVRDETKLQGPLYARALELEFDRQTLAMVYVSLKGEEISYSGWGEVAGLKNLEPIPAGWIDSALERIARAVEAYRAGNVHPLPHNPDACRYCDFRDACRVGEASSLPAAGA